jgi:hypothetical protein
MQAENFPVDLVPPPPQKRPFSKKSITNMS